MIIRKSADELDKMRKAGRIVAGTIETVLAAVEPGRSTLDLDRVAERYIREHGAIPSFKGYRGTYPASICASTFSGEGRARITLLNSGNGRSEMVQKQSAPS